jgi:hypothetical protein
MDQKEKKFIMDKVFIVAVVIGMFVLAAADTVFSSKNETDTCEIVANNISQNCMYINR